MKHRIGALLLLAACSDGDGEAVETVATSLRGEVFFGERAEAWTIEAYEVSGDGSETSVGRASSEPGTFEFELAYRSGMIHLLASNEEQDRVSVFVDAPLDETTDVVLTPVTHLAAVLAQRKMEEGTPAPEAIARATMLVFDHFAGIAHDRVRPYDVTTEPAVSFTDDVAAGFVLEAFATLASRWSDRAPGSVSAGRLLDALAADLLFDGVFDGRGERGQMLELGGRPLSPATVRAELGRALLAFAESTENVTAFGPADLQPMAEAMATNDSELFPEGRPEALDDAPPAFRRWFFSSDGAEVPSDRPLRGTVELVVEVADSSQIDRIGLRGSGLDVEVERRELARFDLDTRALTDGANELEVVAFDEHGNEARLAIRFEVDNTPPILAVEEIGRTAGSTLTIAGTVDEEVEVRARLAVGELGRAGPLSGRFSFSVQVVCGRRFILAIHAIDRAGNTTEIQREVLCDATPPVIEVLATSFIQEGSLLAVHDEGGGLDYVPGVNGIELMSIDAATPWPIRIEKYVNRLDDLDALGVLGGGPNLPRLRFRAVELAGQAVVSSWETLAVEYRYLVDDLEKRPWQRLQPMGGLPEYEVPVAYQWLGPELATSSLAAIHQIEVRAVDEAGLSSSRTFEFTVELQSPPILLSSCAKSPVLGSFDLGLQNMGVLYGTQPESESVVGAIAYPLHLPPGSLAPPLTARVNLSPPGASTRITEFSEDKHQANPNHPDNNRSGLNCLSGSHSEVERPSGQYLGCFLGPMPPSRSLIRDASGLNDAAIHTTRVELRRNGGPLIPAADGTCGLTPDSPAQVRAFLVAPRVSFAGVEYDWRTVFTVPNGYQFGPYPPRYRIDTSWHEGIERARYGSFDPPRAYVTRPYVSELEIEVAPISATAAIEGRPEVAVGVQFAVACSAPIIHQTFAP